MQIMAVTPKDRLPRRSAETEVGDRELVAFGSAADPSQQVMTEHATQHRPDKRCRQAPHARACRHPENSPGAGEDVTIFSERGIAVVVRHRCISSGLPDRECVAAIPHKDTPLFFGAICRKDLHRARCARFCLQRQPNKLGYAVNDGFSRSAK